MFCVCLDTRQWTGVLVEAYCMFAVHCTGILERPAGEAHCMLAVHCTAMVERPAGGVSLYDVSCTGTTGPAC